MKINISKISKEKDKYPIIFISENPAKLKKEDFKQNELEYINIQFENKKKVAVLNTYPIWKYIIWIDTEKEQHIVKEQLRKSAGNLYSNLKENEHQAIILKDLSNNAEYALAFAEGLALSHYQFLKYFQILRIESSCQMSPMSMIHHYTILSSHIQS